MIFYNPITDDLLLITLSAFKFENLQNNIKFTAEPSWEIVYDGIWCFVGWL